MLCRYKNRPEDYVPEALLNIHYPASQERPSFRQLRDNPDATYHSLAITLLRPETSLSVHGYSSSTSAAPMTAHTFDEYVKIEADEYAKTEATIKRYCEQAGDKPELKRFVLPAGDACGSTTSLHTRLRFGSVVHLLVEHYTPEELKKQVHAARSSISANSASSWYALIAFISFTYPLNSGIQVRINDSRAGRREST